MTVDSSKDLHTDYLEVMMGPSHPAMHGITQIKLVLDGETIISADVEPGYLHRGFREGMRGPPLEPDRSLTRTGSTMSLP